VLCASTAIFFGAGLLHAALALVLGIVFAMAGNTGGRESARWSNRRQPEPTMATERITQAGVLQQCGQAKASMGCNVYDNDNNNFNGRQQQQQQQQLQYGNVTSSLAGNKNNNAYNGRQQQPRTMTTLRGDREDQCNYETPSIQTADTTCL
jgi:hypothetical protein